MSWFHLFNDLRSVPMFASKEMLVSTLNLRLLNFQCFQNLKLFTLRLIAVHVSKTEAVMAAVVEAAVAVVAMVAGVEIAVAEATVVAAEAAEVTVVVAEAAVAEAAADTEAADAVAVAVATVAVVEAVADMGMAANNTMGAMDGAVDVEVAPEAEAPAPVSGAASEAETDVAMAEEKAEEKAALVITPTRCAPRSTPVRERKEGAPPAEEGGGAS